MLFNGLMESPHTTYQGLGHPEADFVAGENRRSLCPDAVGHVEGAADVVVRLRCDEQRVHHIFVGRLAVGRTVVSLLAHHRGEVIIVLSAHRMYCQSPLAVPLTSSLPNASR